MTDAKITESTLRIGVIAPEVLGTYGDTGNALILAERARRRGVAAEVVTVSLFEPVPTELDILALGGGEDKAQSLAIEHLSDDPGFHRAYEADRPILAICASLQILGEWYEDARGNRVRGLGVLDVTTQPQGRRSIGELMSEPLLPELTEPLTGFENHGGATTLGPDAAPLGRVLEGTGNGAGGVEGALQRGIVATYMHGPALARNPRLADLLLARAMGVALADLSPLEMPSVDRLRSERLAHFGR